MTERDIERFAPASMLPHMDESADHPSVRNWTEDEFSKWVASHRKELKDLVCSSTTYRDATFCDS